MAKKPLLEATTPAAGLRRTKAPPVGRTVRVKSAAEVSELLGVSRNTIKKWIDNGLPAEPPAKEGGSYLIDVGVCVRWLQDKAAEEARDDEGGAPTGVPLDGGEDADSAKLRRLRADADTSESFAAIKAIDEALKKSAVAPVAIMLDMVRREYSNLSVALAEVGPTVEEKFRAAPPEKIGRAVDDLIRKAIRSQLKLDVVPASQPHPEVEEDERADDGPA